MKGHVHTIPVDSSMTVMEAWKELCIMGVRITNTGSESWGNVRCDGKECSNINWHASQDASA